MKRYLSIGIILSLVALPVRAGEGMRILTLKEALNIAMNRHVDMVIAHERVQQAISRVQQNASPLLPQLNGSASQFRKTVDLRSVGQSFNGRTLIGPFNTFDARVTLTQTIFDVSALNRFKASREGRELSYAEARKIKQDVLALVAHLFITARRSAETTNVYQELVRQNFKQMSITHHRRKLGMASALEMKKARVDYAEALSGWQAAKAEAAERRWDLAAALGLPLEQSLELIWNPQDINTTILKEVSLPTDQPDIVVAEQNLKVAQSQNTAEKAGYLPKISLQGDYGLSGLEPDQASETYGLGVRATIPFFEGGTRQARIKETESVVREQESRFQDVKIQTNAKIMTDVEMVKRSIALMEQKEAEFAVAKEELGIAWQKFNSGAGHNLNLTKAQVRLTVAGDEQDEAIALYILSHVNLARDLGRVEQLFSK